MRVYKQLMIKVEKRIHGIIREELSNVFKN